MEGDNSNALYRECLRNHAASLGSYATDGCGEFTLDDTSPGGLQCAACGCHRNFHRKLSYAAPRGVSCSSGARDHHDQDHPEMAGDMMMMDCGGGGGRQAGSDLPESERSYGKKRFRSKFTADQKEKMLAFAEKLGWKLQRKDQEDEIEGFCRGVGVSRQVFKVWMHNHKNSASSSTASTGNASSLTQ
ncbi:zinc-finger homeodomain protein 10-like [Cornus florida]|uniref:zinc-finger homeodomain protein 10-like n=1 Tax=Cornus florida TaxID=4283 RepID=UPI00289D6EC5|nr:zinc-finger homeodomain protein 10-like [Cornus florida]